MGVVISESERLENGHGKYLDCFYKYKYKCGIDFLGKYGNGNIHIRIKLCQPILIILAQYAIYLNKKNTNKVFKRIFL
jgi:hypothetical protein